jgi:hypothetical protein
MVVVAVAAAAVVVVVTIITNTLTTTSINNVLMGSDREKGDSSNGTRSGTLVPRLLSHALPL